MDKIKIGFCLTGSFCTFQRVIKIMKELCDKGYDVTPIMSFNAYSLDTKFGEAEAFKNLIKDICGKDIICTIQGAEPIGPKKMFDVLIIAPCTGNTIAKLAGAITDTPVTMAAKSHLRNNRPLIIGISTNDGLSGSAKNIGELLNRKNYYFVPFKQDNPTGKPRSIVAEMEMIEDVIKSSLNGEQIQPILL